jgi:hypothetical protein
MIDGILAEMREHAQDEAVFYGGTSIIWKGHRYILVRDFSKLDADTRVWAERSEWYPDHSLYELAPEEKSAAARRYIEAMIAEDGTGKVEDAVDDIRQMGPRT